jgi:adenylate kinase family enzyme
MKRITIIGSPGAGKTTLANELSLMLGIKACHLDRLFWQRGWKGETGETRIDILQNFLLLRNEWIIEGTYLSSSSPRLEAADTIIFLDIFPLLCLMRIIMRYFKYRECIRRRDIPEGCKDKLTPNRMLKTLFFPFKERRRLIRLLNNYESEKIIVLRSRKDVQDFLERMNNFSDANPLPQTGTRSLVHCG